MPGRRTLTGLVVLALLAASAFLAWVAYVDERDRAEQTDANAARQAALTVRQNVTVVASGLRGGSAIVSRDGRVGKVQFRNFARSVLQSTPFLGLAWAPLVGTNGRAEFEATFGRRIKRIGEAGEVVPLEADSDRQYLPLALTYPTTRSRLRTLGFDLLSDPARAETIRKAIRVGEPQLTPPLELAQTGEPGAVMYAPVMVRTEGVRRVAGVLSSAVSGDAVAAQLRRQIDSDETVEISDGGDSLGFARVDDPVEAEIGVLGRQWVVSVERTATVNAIPAVAFGASGLALTLVAAGLFLYASRRERDLVAGRAAAELQSARESLLIRITEVIEREIEVEGRLTSLARTMVPAVGDVCVVHEVTEGVVRQVGVAALDERTEALVRSLPEPPQTSPIRAAISSREPVLYTRVTENREVRRGRERGTELALSSETATPEELLRADERSNLIVPLVARGEVLGTISLTVLASSGRPPLTRDDVAFGMEVATHAAVSLDNARLYEQQRDIAEILQRALLPRSLPEVEGAEVAVRHRPGKAGTEVGGDFYDLFEVGGRWMAVVGDVCGKGPEAAALTALVRHTLRATAQLGPEAAVRRVHEAIKASGENTYCTLCCAELRAATDGLVARVATAGHPEPRVIDRDGSVRRMEVTGPLVGVLERPVFAAQEIRLEPGSLLFMCSDGVPEARRNGEVFGDVRLEEMLARLSPLDPAEMLRQLEEEILSYVEGRPRDDLALFVVRVHEPGSYDAVAAGKSGQ